MPSFCSVIIFVSECVGNIGFSSVPAPLATKGAVSILRAGPLLKSPIEGRQRDREKQSNGDLRASEVHLFLTTSLSLTNS